MQKSKGITAKLNTEEEEKQSVTNKTEYKNDAAGASIAQPMWEVLRFWECLHAQRLLQLCVGCAPAAAHQFL